MWLVVRPWVLVVLVGCGVPRGALDGDGAVSDSSTDASTDARLDARPDANPDAPPIDAPDDAPLLDAPDDVAIEDAPPIDAPVDACEESACSTGLEGICAAGTFSCVSASCTADRGALPEDLCGNTLDDNCEGRVDEGGCIDCLDRYRDGRLYLFCTDVERWVDARDECDALGMRLVAIEDADEQAWIEMQVDEIDAPGYASWWIGLYDALNRDRDEGGDQRNQHRWWPDDSSDPAPTYGHWLTGEPNSEDEDCVRIREAPDRLWTDRACDDSGSEFAYICEPD